MTGGLQQLSIVTDENDRRARGGGVPEQPQDRSGVKRIERGGRLVGQKHGRLREQGPQNRDALALSDGQFRRPGFGIDARQPDRAQPLSRKLPSRRARGPLFPMARQQGLGDRSPDRPARIEAADRAGQRLAVRFDNCSSRFCISFCC